MQGLLSIEDNQEHIFMHVIESAKFKRHKDKVYLGVPVPICYRDCYLCLQGFS